MRSMVIWGAVILGVVGIGWKLQQPDTSADNVVWPSGEITAVTEKTHDWGNINIQGGDIEQTFTFRNSSSDPLVIRDASTSCMCTSARIFISDGDASPQFGMHDNPKNWNGVVSAGKTFDVKVVFDPLAHGPDAVGAIQRGIYLFTSAKPDGVLTQKDSSAGEGSVLEMTVSGMVLSSKDYQQKQTTATTTKVVGDVAWEKTEHDFGRVKQSGGVVTADFPFQYNGKTPITVTSVAGSCACTTGTVTPSTLNPGDRGTLTVTFDPNYHEEPEGKFFRTVQMLTEPALDPPAEAKIWLEVERDLGPTAYKVQTPAPDANTNNP